MSSIKATVETATSSTDIRGLYQEIGGQYYICLTPEGDCIWLYNGRLSTTFKMTDGVRSGNKPDKKLIGKVVLEFS